jgi:hypothetical protein
MAPFPLYPIINILVNNERFMVNNLKVPGRVKLGQALEEIVRDLGKALPALSMLT